MADDSPNPPPTPSAAATAPERAQRVVNDAQTMRALSHPVRIALLDALSLVGPLTATEAGARIGESSTTCSFHLRQLHRYGFVEEVGGGKGRARPWRVSHTGLRFSTEEGDVEARVAAGTLARLTRERQLGRLQSWLETRDAYPRQWRTAASSSEYVTWMTAAELEQLESELYALLADRFAERQQDPAARPEGALPVEILTYSFPIDPAPGGAQ